MIKVVGWLLGCLSMSVSATTYQIHYGKWQGQFVPMGAVSANHYLNQPEFSADATRLLYTEQRGDAAMATDIMQLDIKTGRSTPFKTTEFGEFSATKMPDAPNQYSVVRVEQDGRQRLWQLSSDSERLLFPELAGVGYHVWGQHGDLLLFLLEDASGPNRAVYRSRDGKIRTLAGHIGRALVIDRAREQFYFTAPNAKVNADPNELWLWQFSPNNAAATAMLPLPKNAQDLAIGADGQVWASSGSNLFVLSDHQWQSQLDVKPFCKGKVSRFKFEPTQQLLAFVCESAS